MQIVGYETAGTPDETAALLLAAEDGVERVSLEPGIQLAYGLARRHCAGQLSDDGHEPCDVATAPYCDRHADRWPCARCAGDCDLPLPECQEEHAVYLAAFAPDLFKVGVTRSWRLERRLREQGADRAAHLRTVIDGRVAREIETEIASSIGDSVRVAAKLDGLHRSVDDDAWEECLRTFDPIETYTFEYNIDLTERPVGETMAAGTVRGSQGRLLVLERAGSRYAVDLRDLVGFEVTDAPAERQLQSHLGAFE
ncbi:MAG: DUF2797 domain-containing protein [Salinirussus sp.]